MRFSMVTTGPKNHFAAINTAPLTRPLYGKFILSGRWQPPIRNRLQWLPIQRINSKDVICALYESRNIRGVAFGSLLGFIAYCGSRRMELCAQLSRQDGARESLHDQISRDLLHSRSRPPSRERQSNRVERPALQNTASRLGMAESQ